MKYVENNEATVIENLTKLSDNKSPTIKKGEIYDRFTTSYLGSKIDFDIIQNKKDKNMSTGISVVGSNRVAMADRPSQLSSYILSIFRKCFNEVKKEDIIIL